MQAWYDARFEREMGCTEADLLRCLPGAAAPHRVSVAHGAATVHIGPGRLELHWRPLPERRIASMRMPCLHVSFTFDQVDAAARQSFMRRFDLYTQRGGG
jgi:hypothetical protein